MRKRLYLTTVLASCASTFLPACLGQTPDATAPAASPAQAQPNTPAPLPRFGIAVSAGTLGAGIQIGTAIARHTNIRGGVNYFNYSLSGTDSSNGLAYNGKLRLESGEVLLDQNFGAFHISGGALVYDGFQGSGSVQVPGGQSLTLNNVSYMSAPSDPVTGNGVITVRKVAPELLFGFGNLLPRSKRHFTVNFEFGAAFQGSPNVALSLNGSTCLAGTCTTISSNSTTQSNIMAEQTKISNTLKPFQFYPVIRISFGYKH